MLLDSLPDSLIASLEVRDAWRRKVAMSTPGLEFVGSDLSRWRPRLGGSDRVPTGARSCTPTSSRPSSRSVRPAT